MPGGVFRIWLTTLGTKKITARMCLGHTTGFPNWRWLTPQGLDENGKLRIDFDPGTNYQYSGEGIRLLQIAVEENHR